MSKKLVLAVLVVAASVALVTGVIASHGTQSAAASPQRTLTDAELPAGGIELLEAVPFALDEPFVHEWRVEKPLVASGYLLVLRTDPELARPRQTAEAVLYVGTQTAERCSFPESSGILVALVPAPLAADGTVDLDLATTPVWFGRRELPERVDARRIAEELALARRAGLGPVERRDQPAIRSVPVRARDRFELEATYLADLVERWSPEQADLVRGLRVR